MAENRTIRPFKVTFEKDVIVDTDSFVTARKIAVKRINEMSLDSHDIQCVEDYYNEEGE